MDRHTLNEVNMKALASDFDGTLRLYNETGAYVRKEDIAAIRAFQNAGNLFGICTGRPLSGLMHVLPEGIVPDFYIVSSGAAIAETDGRGVRHPFLKTMDTGIIRELYEQFGNDVLFIIHTDEKIRMMDRKSDAFSEDMQIVLHDPGQIGELTAVCVSIGAGSEEKAVQYASFINRTYGDRVHAFQNIDYLDVINADCSKGTGALQAKQLYGIDILYGIGDSFNDIPLLDASDTAFTFHRSPSEVKAHAQYTVGSIAEAVKIITEGER